jgi:cytolysin (calcineurin-like family phosphatase)
MFGQLMAGDTAFWPLAEKYALTYVLAGGNLARGVETGALPGLNVVYRGESLMIFRAVRP